jgi:hypothetical protein
MRLYPWDMEKVERRAGEERLKSRGFWRNIIPAETSRCAATPAPAFSQDLGAESLPYTSSVAYSF